MQPRKFLVLTLTILSLVISSCSPAAAPDKMMDKPATEAMMEKPATEAMMEKPTEDGMAKEIMATEAPEAMMEKPTEEAMKDDEMMVELPAWFSAGLVDVRNGQTFTINDLKGKVILVEMLAMWCSNCLKQQKQVLELHQLLGEKGDFISIGLDIDANEDANSLKGYIERNGFNWVYAVSPAEVSREISNLYGGQFINPPSTPMLIIDRHGKAHILPFGVKSAAQLLEALKPFLEEDM
jgi:thiol-disulfide isomerase/thioredoxin